MNEYTPDEERTGRYLATAGYLTNLAETDSMAGSVRYLRFDKAIEAAVSYANDQWTDYVPDREES